MEVSAKNAWGKKNASHRLFWLTPAFFSKSQKTLTFAQGTLVVSPYMLVVPRPGKIKKKYLPGLGKKKKYPPGQAKKKSK